MFFYYAQGWGVLTDWTPPLPPSQLERSPRPSPPVAVPPVAARGRPSPPVAVAARRRPWPWPPVAARRHFRTIFGKRKIDFLTLFWDFQMLSFFFAPLGVTVCALAPGL